jgi:hypothetical protein
MKVTWKQKAVAVALLPAVALGVEVVIYLVRREERRRIAQLGVREREDFIRFQDQEAK